MFSSNYKLGHIFFIFNRKLQRIFFILATRQIKRRWGPKYKCQSKEQSIIINNEFCSCHFFFFFSTLSLFRSFMPLKERGCHCVHLEKECWLNSALRKGSISFGVVAKYSRKLSARRKKVRQVGLLNPLIESKEINVSRSKKLELSMSLRSTLNSAI